MEDLRALDEMFRNYYVILANVYDMKLVRNIYFKNKLEAMKYNNKYFCGYGKIILYGEYIDYHILKEVI